MLPPGIQSARVSRVAADHRLLADALRFWQNEDQVSSYRSQASTLIDSAGGVSLEPPPGNRRMPVKFAALVGGHGSGAARADAAERASQPATGRSGLYAGDAFAKTARGLEAVGTNVGTNERAFGR